MTARQINFALRVASISLISLAGVFLVIGLLLPLQSPESTATKPGTQNVGAGIPGILPPLDSFARAWETPLRRPLDDSIVTDHAPVNPDTTTTTAGTGGAIGYALVGTVGESLAMLKGPDGLVVVRGIGDEVGVAHIIAVRPSQVDLNLDGRTVMIQKASDDEGEGIIKGASDVPDTSASIPQK